jgi:hypothetical protein
VSLFPFDSCFFYQPFIGITKFSLFKHIFSFWCLLLWSTIFDFFQFPFLYLFVLMLASFVNHF